MFRYLYQFVSLCDPAGKLLSLILFFIFGILTESQYHTAHNKKINRKRAIDDIAPRYTYISILTGFVPNITLHKQFVV